MLKIIPLSIAYRYSIQRYKILLMQLNVNEEFPTRHILKQVRNILKTTFLFTNNVEINFIYVIAAYETFENHLLGIKTISEKQIEFNGNL